MTDTADIVIIGAGVIGCSSAYHLARGGAGRILLLERDQVGSGSSSKSAAMLTLQFSKDRVLASLGRRAYRRYMAFEEEPGGPIDFRRTGWLTLVDESGVGRLRQRATMLQSLGIDTLLLDPAQVAQRYPELQLDDIALAAFGPDDGPLDPHLIMWGYLRAARALGVTVRQGVRACGLRLSGGRVTAVETDQGPIGCGAVVNAAGPWAAEVAGWTGFTLPLRNSQRTILVTRPTAAVPPGRPFVDDESLGWYFRRDVDGVLIGGGAVPSPRASVPLNQDQVDHLVEAAVRRLPALAEAGLQTAWTGVRPLSADGRPFLGAQPDVGGLWLNAAWGGVGIIMAPVAGELLADLLLGGPAAAQATPFDPARPI